MTDERHKAQDRGCEVSSGNNSKHVLFVVNDDDYFLAHWLHIAVAARQAGYRVSVSCASNGRSDEIRSHGLHLEPLSIQPHSVNPVLDLRLLASIADIYRRLTPDIVHHVAIKPVIYGSIAARWLGVPKVINALVGLGYVFSSVDVRARLVRPIVRTLMRGVLVPRNGALTLQNSDDLEYLRQKKIVGNKEGTVIKGAGVDIERFRPTPEPRGVPVVVLPGRMLRQKGVETFVEAARFLKRRAVEARFVLVGEPPPGNPDAIPSSLLERWSMEGVVEYWGWQHNMPEVYAQAAIVCLPSHAEGLPTALTEAAASARPVVTTDSPGCRQAVDDRVTGMVVQPGDAVALAGALRYLLEAPNLRKEMGQRGRRRAVEHFSSEDVASHILRVYSDDSPLRLEA